jgi:hypothetical protein
MMNEFNFLMRFAAVAAAFVFFDVRSDDVVVDTDNIRRQLAAACCLSSALGNLHVGTVFSHK